MTGIACARAASIAAAKAYSEQVSANTSAGPPIPNRVYLESGVCTETVRLGISARRRRVSSVLGITLIIGEAVLARSAFPGFPKEGLDFFRSLARNNRREWFQPRKHLFEMHLKQPMRDLVIEVNREMSRFAPEYITDPDKAIYRIYRDTRFSKDKTPYKDHIAASFHHRSADVHGEAGFYFAISHKEVAVGGGVYMPAPETLQAIRTHLAGNHAAFRKLIRARRLRGLMGEMQGSQLSRVPKGYPPDHPAADLVRYKQFLFYIELSPELAPTGNLQSEIVSRFRAITPFLRFLNTPFRQERKPIIPKF
jgi:uncharacterized protein (TIGR02453 family)